MKKIALIITLCFCIMSLSVEASGADSSKTLDGTRYQHISSFKTNLKISSSGKASIRASIKGDTSVKKVKIESNLMRYKNGHFSTYMSWNKTKYNNYAFINESYYVPSGYIYKLVTTVYVYDAYGSLLDSLTEETNICYY